MEKIGGHWWATENPGYAEKRMFCDERMEELFVLPVGTKKVWLKISNKKFKGSYKAVQDNYRPMNISFKTKDGWGSKEVYLCVIDFIEKHAKKVKTFYFGVLY